jgi:hypothetical protein
MALEKTKRLIAAAGTHSRIFRRIWVAVIVLPFFASAVLSACRQQDPPVETRVNPLPGIHKKYDRGPATCLLDVDKSEITIADRLELAIAVIIDPGFEAEMPSIGEKLDRFGVVDYHTPPAELTADGRTKISRSYVLEPFLSGEYTIPALTVHFWKTGAKDTEMHDITTQALSIKVNSLLPQNLKEVKLHDIQPPVTVPADITPWMWAAAGGGVLVVLLVGFFWIRHRGRRAGTMAQQKIAPHEQAYEELAALIARNLIESGEIKLFYQEISNILRRYIENRFGINAPEQTTEEFLEGLKTHATFPVEYQDLLKRFLIHCDLVKFAAHQPVAEDIQNTVESCGKFIDETALKAADAREAGEA